MIEIEEVPELDSPVLIAAFEGWNDAADAASSVVDHLIKVWDAKVVAAIDPEDFYDFQMNRPVVGTTEAGMRKITWPSTQISVARPPGATCATWSCCAASSPTCAGGSSARSCSRPARSSAPSSW